MKTDSYTVKLSTTGAQLHRPADSRNLLETLEHHQVQIEYQCRSGYCGSCRLRLLKGEVCYSQPPLAFIQPNEILPCCCQPLGDIEIEL
ncbi:class I ribonucleotide reductase maintenance protein YfaE [Yersinia mollaretii]|uniref:Ferredoxin n=1 Tax=Yersinia mollaretii (strain ATCC 43969 / DSM 18520 / CIP 103324 / CNY 7263 / WAIP 204) TaxID=349967 RepID=A0ABP2EDV6_YERMW|nr:class I ribonucleotide reductase maintenance protein YfaE [Yersinia mollaretii]EEQ10552.1 Ferredoxin [Yersinia mollaretii ATCC 43969]MDN0111612.1 class I ribonucleotide reductase maintenance protein YfaE [Yersinia mollaretii]PJE89794.1 2Fe-2S ferredoxin [Yersinia mollaretii]QKJ03656.1 2Fe-2S ferredoxin-like protein [Yersinia mollaretii ATCC 43969]CNK03126.1 2Fe-2S ferredoxin YfaE [Yersinia mollaretii]